MAASSPAPAPSRRRAIAAASVGNALEWFDWTVYATFAIFFSSQFFPPGNETAALLAAYGIFAVGFIMRPLGGWVIGVFADRRGRKAALVLSEFQLVRPQIGVGHPRIFFYRVVAVDFEFVAVRIEEVDALGYPVVYGEVHRHVFRLEFCIGGFELLFAPQPKGNMGESGLVGPGRLSIRADLKQGNLVVVAGMIGQKDPSNLRRVFHDLHPQHFGIELL